MCIRDSIYSDKGIVSLVQDKPDNNLKNSEEHVPTDFVLHSEAANALELALHYGEQHTAATLTDLMFMRCWHNIASVSYTHLDVYKRQVLCDL